MSLGHAVIGIPPQLCTAGSVSACVAVARKIAATACGCPFSFGHADISSAATPATCGVAMLVPLSILYAFGGTDDTMSLPGADRSGRISKLPCTGPREEK